MTVIRFFTTNGIHSKKPAEAIDYLYSDYAAITEEEKQLNQNIEHGALREPPPESISNNKSSVIYAIKHNPHKYKYSSGVIAYHADDTETLQNDPRIEIEYRVLFEEMCFAGLPLEDRLLEWCRHTHAGNIENHFVIPRIHLRTGYYFNPHPPRSESDFRLIVDYLDAKYLLTKADTPVHQQPFGHISPYDPQKKLKLSICQQIRVLHKSSELKNKKDILNWLSSQSFKTQFKVERVELKADHTRLYFSGKTKAIRLKGTLFSCSKRQFTQQPLDLRLLEMELCRRIQKRADFNRKRYRVTQSMVNQQNYELPLFLNKLELSTTAVVVPQDFHALLEAIILLIQTILKLLTALLTGITDEEYDENRRTIISIADSYEERYRAAKAAQYPSHRYVESTIPKRSEANTSTNDDIVPGYVEPTGGVKIRSGNIKIVLDSIRAEIEDEQQFQCSLVERANSTYKCCREISDRNRRIYEFLERSFTNIVQSDNLIQRNIYKLQGMLKKQKSKTHGAGIKIISLEPIEK